MENVNCTIEYVGNKKQHIVFDYYNNLNNDTSHFINRDDICTPMACVTAMVDYLPEELWKRENLKIIDACCGNGNFGAVCMFKTSLNNIWFNELNLVRFENCKRILNPKHITNTDAFSITSYGEWDLSISNPPYSGGGNKNQSLSNKFIEHSIDLLKNGGYLCFVTPNNWMTYNNKNTTLARLLNEGSFIIIDNSAKKYFPGVGSSFTIFVWQKGVMNNKTRVINDFLIKDEQFVSIPKTIPFIPLYLSQETISLVEKYVDIENQNERFFYRCDLHNFTQKDKLNDERDDIFKYETIHTARKTRYASIKQDIYDKWIIVVPLSTYFIPYVRHNVNTTQSVGYISFDTEKEATEYLETINRPLFKVLIHITRYGNFNNIMLLKHLRFDADIKLTKDEESTINKLIEKIKY